MAAFSKPIREHNDITNKFVKSSPVVQENFDYALTIKDYYAKKIDLKKCKLPELKTIVKQYNLARTGNKDVLIDRIKQYFNKTRSTVVIQKTFRGWLVRYSFKLRGDCHKNRSICVNSSDFITLEPLEEIPFQLFYSYKDEKEFVYGFNITSLIQLIKNQGKIDNPYNREKLSKKIINEIIALNNITRIISPEHADELTRVRLVSDKKPQNILNIQRNQPIPITAALITTLNMGVNVDYFHPRLYNNVVMNDGIREKYNRIVDSRMKPLRQRIQDLFMEIDHLGNYTQSSWFSNLERRDCMRFFRCLHDIWTYRANLSQDVKLRICPLFDPFANFLNTSIYSVDTPTETIQLTCITVMENMIYSGIDDDHRKIAALHLLSALTVVSFQARNAMMWLYESIAY
jgi:hypothetical protein